MSSNYKPYGNNPPQQQAYGAYRYGQNSPAPSMYSSPHQPPGYAPVNQGNHNMPPHMAPPGYNAGPPGMGGVAPQPSPQVVVEERFKKLPKVELGTKSREERHMFDNLADLYAILILIERLETAWTRGSIHDDVYTKECSAQIAKFKAQRENVEKYCSDVDKFVKDYRMHCGSALKRVQKGIPGTIENPSITTGDEKDNVYVAETVQHFITTMDGLKLEMRAVDDLQPNVHELMDSLNKVARIPPDHASKTKVKDWLIKLNQMRASDELDEDQARQMSFDLENGYNSFVKFLSKKS